jgi:hypothetical protein
MSSVEAAWVGAFIEADGSVSESQPRAFTWRITVAQKEIEPISTLLRFTGGGTVCLGYTTYKTLKYPIWLWNVTRKLDVLALARQCAPYCVKLQKLQQAKRLGIVTTSEEPEVA